MILLKRILKWAGIILAGSFILLVIVRAFHFYNLDKTNAVVEKIHATKLQLADVMGGNLPPDPGIEADKTIEGIDFNKNGIRDDVEIAIFKEYPNSAKTRAVLLQYALALQMQMTLPIVNKETVIATAEEKSNANICTWDLGDNFEEYRNFVIKLQNNTKEREDYLNSIYVYLGSYSALSEGCHLDLSTLPK